MRTREDQIREIAAVRDEVNPTRTGIEAEKWAEQHILEAERRAEQRVRAEIAKSVSALFDSYDAYDRPCKQFVMEAIDAAREVG